MKRFFITALLYCSLLTLPVMSQTLTEIYKSIPDTIMPKLSGFEPEIIMGSDTLMQIRVNKVNYELAKASDNQVVLLVTLPLPEHDTRAYLYNIYNTNNDSESSKKLSWNLENSRDFSNGEFKFAEATITSVSPLLVQVTIREPFIPKDEKNEPLVLKNIKIF
jgi:hypothetical protein